MSSAAAARCAVATVTAPRARRAALAASRRRDRAVRPRRVSHRQRPIAAASASSSSSSGVTTPDEETLAKILAVATDAAKKGAAVMLQKLGADVVKTKANTRDLLTEVDPEVQEIISSAVRLAFPDHGFLGEESVPPGMEASSRALDEILTDGPEYLWVVDPIDGTTNFVHGMPLSAISIGVAHKARSIHWSPYDRVGVVNAVP